MNNSLSKKRFTILFTDIVGSTTMYNDFGDDYAHKIVKQHDNLLEAVINEYEGWVVKKIGDAFMVYFDNPSEAFQCSIMMQRQMDLERMDSEEFNISIRIGVHTGIGILDGNDVYGEVVNIASRVEGLAGTNQILISRDTFESIDRKDQKKCQYLSKFDLKGIQERLDIYKATWTGDYSEYLDNYPDKFSIRLIPERFNDINSDVISLGSGYYKNKYKKNYSFEEVGESIFQKLRVISSGGMPKKIILYPDSMTLKPSKEFYRTIFRSIFIYLRKYNFDSLTSFLTGTSSGITRKESTSIIVREYLKYLDQNSTQSSSVANELNIVIKSRDLNSFYERNQYITGVSEIINRWKSNHKQICHYNHEILEDLNGTSIISHQFSKQEIK